MSSFQKLVEYGCQVHYDGRGFRGGDSVCIVAAFTEADGTKITAQRTLTEIYPFSRSLDETCRFLLESIKRLRK